MSDYMMTSDMNPVSSTALVPFSQVSSPTKNGDQDKVKAHQKHLQELALNDLDAEEVGKVVTQLQEEISIIKLQLENLPGYDKGKSQIIIRARFLPVTICYI